MAGSIGLWIPSSSPKPVLSTPAEMDQPIACRKGGGEASRSDLGVWV